MQDASIIARLGLDTAGFKRGLSEAAAASDRMARERKQANESVLESDKKVEGQLGSLIERMRGVESAGGAAANVVEAFAESINLSLAAAVGAAASLSFVRYLQAIGTEAAKAREELEALLKPSQAPDFSALSALEQRVSSLRKKFEELTRPPGGSWWSPLTEGFKDVVSFLAESKIAGGEGGSLLEIAGRKISEIEKTSEALADAQARIAEKAAGATRVMELQASGQETAAALEKIRLDYAEKIGAAIAQQNAGLAEELKKQQALAEFTERRNAAEKELANAEAVIGKYQKELEEADKLAEEQKKNGEELNRHMRSLAEKFHADQKKQGEELDKHTRSLADRFRADQKKKDEEAAEAVIGKWQEALNDRDQAKRDFIAGKMAGPDARREAERRADEEARIGRQFDRLEDQERRGNRARADVEKEKLGDALKAGRLDERLKPKGIDDMLERARHGNEMLDRRGQKGPVAQERPMEKTEQLLGKIEEHTRKLGVNL